MSLCHHNISNIQIMMLPLAATLNISLTIVCQLHNLVKYYMVMTCVNQGMTISVRISQLCIKA